MTASKASKQRRMRSGVSSSLSLAMEPAFALVSSGSLSTSWTGETGSMVRQEKNAG